MRGVQLLSPTFCLCSLFLIAGFMLSSITESPVLFQLQLLPSAQGDTILYWATSPETANFSVNKFPREKHTREKDLEQTSREVLSVPKNSWKLSGIAFLQQTLLKIGKYLTRTTPQNPWECPWTTTKNSENFTGWWSMQMRRDYLLPQRLGEL